MLRALNVCLSDCKTDSAANLLIPVASTVSKTVSLCVKKMHI